MTETSLRDRRFRSSGPTLRRDCRLCWRSTVLGLEHVEVTDQHVYVRCPHCGGSFPIRHSDIETLLGYERAIAG
jgi:hypothetical protein